jgi:hypothetical protein
MIPEIDIWRVAALMISRCGEHTQADPPPLRLPRTVFADLARL